MLVEEYAGRRVHEAKPLVRNKLVELGGAVMYSEPEKKVMSREAEWKKMAEECLSYMNLYFDETRHGFEHTFSWLN
ncbi:hypothetical protein Ddye_008276 [Dipteronia dyeriana]|uniref:Uncharacterized protein n=1 Tax=Dipteronia dyeriana TaxID=168575 RepID=A0AAE0CL77_9ROSI|nr:hypothetical protein Ddye_008276 [Dipteronia dyeriana]